MKFLTFLFLLFAGIWFVGLVMRSVFSRWLRRRAEEFDRAARQAQQQARQGSGRASRRVGEVTVEGTAQKKVNRSVGEYVEFEEIKE